MKKINKLINEVEKMLKEANKEADSSASGYDQGFYVGKGEALEEVLKLLEENKK
jgi:hypothetical protein